MATISEQLRQAMEAYGSGYRLAKDTGIPQPVIARFLNGTRDLHLATVDKLAVHLGLELTPRRTARRRRK